MTLHKFKHLMKDQLENQPDEDSVLSKEQIDGKKFATKQSEKRKSRFFQLSNLDFVGGCLFQSFYIVASCRVAM